jgi:hypothetical protein
MRILLVEPEYRRLSASKRAAIKAAQSGEAAKRQSDDTLWYPPLGLMKLSRFHKDRKDEVTFVTGCDESIFFSLFEQGKSWDRIYITTLFTFNWAKIVETINFYKKAVGGSTGKIFVGGIMSSLMAEDLFEETGVYPVTGTITSPSQIGLSGAEVIDELPPDYGIISPALYAINDTYYGYTSRGCINRCTWCGVPKIEPEYIPYIDIKPVIYALRKEYGDKPRLRLMDNNVLASAHLEQIVDDLVELGYGRECFTETRHPKRRVVDFNQGLDASFLDVKRMELIERLNVRPMRIAFDRAIEKKPYTRALEVAQKHGVREFSNYMLYNWKDTPRDLYDRLVVNIRLNEKWAKKGDSKSVGAIYSYPMRFAPINCDEAPHANRKRDINREHEFKPEMALEAPNWNPRFIRNIEIMKGAAHGAISPTSTWAWRTIGKSFEEFLSNLYMPEELLRNRSRHEKYVHPHEPPRKPGTGKLEEFRKYILNLIKQGGPRFVEFHEVVSANSTKKIREAIEKCRDKEMWKWLQFYLMK